MKIVSAGALYAALTSAPLLTVIIVVLSVVSAAAFLRWFARQTKPARADVIRLIRALRGN